MTSVAVDRWTGVAEVINTSSVPADMVAGSMRDNPELRPLADAMMQWVNRTQVNQRFDRRGKPSRFGGLLERDRYLTPGSPYDQMRVARQALADDVVGGAADGTEALAFDGVGFSVADSDQENIWNQIAADIDMDGLYRKAWRTLYTDSQFVAAVWWGQKDYTVRKMTAAGRRSTKQFKDLTVPVKVTLLDSTKVAPVGNLMFGLEQLAYVADPIEAAQFDTIIAKRDMRQAPDEDRTAALARLRKMQLRTPAGARFSNYPRLTPAQMLEQVMSSPDDPIVEQLIVDRYYPGLVEWDLLQSDGVACENLFILNPDYVFRHTLTKGDYQRFADVRLVSCFEILDIKSQLKQMDRAHLIGGTHFIVVISKGTDLLPAEQAEINALRAQVDVIAQVPVIVSDHRLKVEIVTPKLDLTLHKERYDTVDSRLFARSWGSFVPTGADNDDPVKLGKVIGKGLQSRRKMARRTFELKIVHPAYVANPQLTDRVKTEFSPAIISVAYDAALASFILEQRQTGDVSRHTSLSLFDLSQADEARHRQREQEEYDEIFQTKPPAGAPNPDGGGRSPVRGGGGDRTDDPARRAGGRAGGGQRRGGGAAPGSGQGQAPRRGRRTRRQLLDRAAEIVSDGGFVATGRWRMNLDALEAAIDEAELTLTEEDE